MVIMPRGGLCNYLRVIFSCYNYTKSRNIILVVIWLKTNACNGYFLDYFKPIKGIKFIRNIPKSVKINYKSFNIYKGYPANYKKLKLLSHVKNIIKTRIKILKKNYISCHIRRTDHIKLAKKYKNYTTDQDFMNYINSNIKNRYLYIATDNKDTYNKFKNKYSKFVKFEYHNKLSGLRQTNLINAIIDIYVCIYSKVFMGSGYSSFSGLIKNLRNLRNLRKKKNN